MLSAKALSFKLSEKEIDRESVILKLEKTLSSFGKSKITVRFETEDVVKIEIICNIFKNVIITKRIDMVSNTILDISMTDLRENNISIIALKRYCVKKGDGFGVHPSLN